MNNSIIWLLKHFDQLSAKELYAILQLRNEVFVVEQNCVYQDADNKDPEAFHFMGWRNETLIAYTRILPVGLAYKDFISIGRVVTAHVIRRNTAGKELMRRSIEQVNTLFGNVPIKIGAQLYLKKFYIQLGFHQTSQPYLEDGIEHIEMLRPVK